MHQQIVEGAHLNAFCRSWIEMLELLAHDGDALVGAEERSLAGVARDANDQSIDDLHGAKDDIRVTVGDRIESAGINSNSLAHQATPPSPAPASPLPLPLPFPLPTSPVSGSRATETTRSSSSTLNTVTPPLRRRRMLISSTGTRISWPRLVTSMIWSSWLTGKTATVAPWPRLGSLFSRPCAPRPVI